MNFFVKCVCPSCFAEINLGECRILSRRTSGKVLKNPSKNPLARLNVEPLDGPYYTTELACRECYECKYLLPSNIERVPSIILVVVGDVASGKSHYLASFIHQLKTEWINNATGFVSFECLTPDVENDYINNYFEPLFVHQKALALTSRGTSPYARPLIYELAVAQSPRHPVTSTNLMIYDTSGEDYEAEDRLVNFARFVLNTTAFIFAVNPVAIDAVFRNLDPALKARPQLQAQYTQGRKRRLAERLNAIMSIYGRFHGHAKGSRLHQTPVAVMVSKSDLLPHTSTVMHAPYYGGGVDLQDIATIDEEVRNLLQQYYAQGDLIASTSRLAKVKFFATSATGGPPDAYDNFTHVKPLRCLDPVLWILHELGIIRATK